MGSWEAKGGLGSTDVDGGWGRSPPPPAHHPGVGHTAPHRTGSPEWSDLGTPPFKKVPHKYPNIKDIWGGTLSPKHVVFGFAGSEGGLGSPDGSPPPSWGPLGVYNIIWIF